MRNYSLALLCALEAIIWGIWIGNPWWSVFDTSHAFDWMAKFAPEWLWGSTVLIVGVLQLLILLKCRVWLLHVIITALGLFIWTLIITGFALGNWHSTAIPVYSFITFMQFQVVANTLLAWRQRDLR